MATSVAGAQDLGGTTPPASSGGGGESITSTAGATDHSVVVNRLGLRYFGAAPLASLTSSGMPGGGTQTLHTVGARYWLNGGMALEGGLSLGFSSGSNTTTVQTGGMTTTTSSDQPNFFGIGFVFGVPIALAEAKHLHINVTPYLSLHYGRSAITTGSGDSTTDNTLGAFRLGIGANAAAEVQFGFIGLPQLGLQAQLGIGVFYNSTSYEARVVRNNNTTTASTSSFNIATTVGPNYSLGDIISGSISAIYYFGNAPQR